MYYNLKITNTTKTTRVDEFTKIALEGKPIYLNKGGYATFVDGTHYVHHLAFQPYHESKPGFHIDHINGDKLDNRQCNLQWIPAAANTAKGLPQHRDYDKYSNYKGVSFDKSTGVWLACIGTKVRCSCQSEFDAAMCRDYLFRVTYPSVAFQPNIPEVVLTEREYNIIRLTNQGNSRNGHKQEVWLRPAKKRDGKFYYQISFSTSKGGKAKRIESTNKKYVIKWYRILSGERSNDYRKAGN